MIPKTLAVSLVMCGVLGRPVAAQPEAAKPLPPRSPLPAAEADELRAFMRALWEPIIGNADSKPLLAACDVEMLVDDALDEMRLGPKDRGPQRVGNMIGLRGALPGALVALATPWKGGWLDVRGGTRDAHGRLYVEVVLFSFETEGITFIDWRCAKKDGRLRWLDLRGCVAGTGMADRLVASHHLENGTPEQVNLDEKFEQAIDAQQWAEARRCWKAMAPAMQSSRVNLYRAREAAGTAGDAEWAAEVREPYLRCLGVDDTLLLGDVDRCAAANDLAGALDAMRKLRDLKGGHPLLHYKCSGIEHALEQWDACQASAEAAIRGAPGFYVSHVMLVAAHARAGRNTEATLAAKECVRRFPNLTFDWHLERLFGAFATTAEFRAAFGR